MAPWGAPEPADRGLRRRAAPTARPPRGGRAAGGDGNSAASSGCGWITVQPPSSTADAAHAAKDASRPCVHGHAAGSARPRRRRDGRVAAGPREPHRAGHGTPVDAHQQVAVVRACRASISPESPDADGVWPAIGPCRSLSTRLTAGTRAPTERYSRARPKCMPCPGDWILNSLPRRETCMTCWPAVDQSGAGSRWIGCDLPHPPWRKEST